MTTQNAKGPAATAIAPDHGSILSPSKDIEMNEATNTTAAADAPIDKSLARSRLLDICNSISVVKNLNEALFMAVNGLSDMRNVNALHSVIDEIESRLGIVEDRIDVVREMLA